MARRKIPLIEAEYKIKNQQNFSKDANQKQQSYYFLWHFIQIKEYLVLSSSTYYIQP